MQTSTSLSRRERPPAREPKRMTFSGRANLTTLRTNPDNSLAVGPESGTFAFLVMLKA